MDTAEKLKNEYVDECIKIRSEMVNLAENLLSMAEKNQEYVTAANRELDKKFPVGSIKHRPRVTTMGVPVADIIKGCKRWVGTLRGSK